MLPASALPLNTGVVSLVAPPAAIGTGVWPESLLSCSPVAALGASVSTVKAIAVDGALLLPAASVTVAVRLCAPWLSAGEVKLQVPSVQDQTRLEYSKECAWLVEWVVSKLPYKTFKC